MKVIPIYWRWLGDEWQLTLQQQEVCQATTHHVLPEGWEITHNEGLPPTIRTEDGVELSHRNLNRPFVLQYNLVRIETPKGSVLLEDHYVHPA